MHMNGDSMHLGGYAPVDLIKRTPTGRELIQRYSRSFVIHEGRSLAARTVEFYWDRQKRYPLRTRVGGPRLDIREATRAISQHAAASSEIIPAASNKIGIAGATPTVHLSRDYNLMNNTMKPRYHRATEYKRRRSRQAVLTNRARC